MNNHNHKLITIIALFLFLFGAVYFNQHDNEITNNIGFIDFNIERNLTINDLEDETYFIFGINHIQGLDPHRFFGFNSWVVIDQVFETLYAYNLSDPNLPIIPRLASSKGIWSSDGLNYTIPLNSGIIFHDQTNFDAFAVKWSFERLAYFMNASGNTPEPITPPLFDYLYLWDDGTPIINRTEVVNTNTIKFVLNRPYGAFEGLLCFSGSGIMSPLSTPATEYIDHDTGDFVGTGPFVYDGFLNREELILHAFDNYHQGVANLTHLKFSIIHDSQLRNQALLSGDIDALYNPLDSILETFIEDPMINVESGNSTVTYFISMNNNVINKTIRQAISYAFNYSYFIKDICHNSEGTRLRSPVPEEILYSNGSFEIAEMNITEARKRLIDAGICDYEINADVEWVNAAINNPIATYTYIDLGGLTSQRTGELLNANLERIGIKLNIIMMEWGEFLDTLVFDPDSMHLYCIGERAYYNDPLFYTNLHFSSQSKSNYAQVNDPYLETLLEQGLLETDSSLRELIYDEIQQYLVEELMPYAFCCVTPHHLAYILNVTGFHINPFRKIWFYDVSSEITRPFVDSLAPKMNIIYYDAKVECAMGNLSIKVLISDNVQVDSPVTIDFYYPNGTFIETNYMNWDFGDLYSINWNATSYPTLYGYSFKIYANDTSGNEASIGDYFHIINPVPIPNYLEINPIIIDDTGNEGYTWEEVANEAWCSGSGTITDPYLIENISIDGQGIKSCIEIKYSNKYFIIKNSHFTNSGFTKAGINLYYADNGKIINNNCSQNSLGIYIARGSNFNISNNILIDNTWMGIQLNFWHNNCIITGNIAVNNGQHGIVIRQESYFNIISENLIVNHIYSGILIQGGSKYNIIESNTLYANSWGIWIYNSNNNICEENIIVNSEQEGILIEESNYNRIENNTVYKNKGNGITLQSYDYIEAWCIGNTILKNNISENLKVGIAADRYSIESLIYLNIFIDNNIQAEDNGTNNEWDNGTIGNYWDDYTGVDLNDDGIGDVPYNISGAAGATDNYPIWDDGPDVIPLPEYIENVIDTLLSLEIPEEAHDSMEKAILFLTQAKEKFEIDRIYESFDKIKKSVELLMIVGEMGVDTYEVIDSIMFLVQYIVDQAMIEALETVSEDNKFIIKAVEDYNTALQLIENGIYDEAVKYFKFSLRNIITATATFDIELFI